MGKNPGDSGKGARLTANGKLWIVFVTALFLGVVFRLSGGLIPEILALVCWLTAIVVGAKLWRLSHPRATLDDAQADRIEREKLARYGLDGPNERSET